MHPLDQNTWNLWTL